MNAFSQRAISPPHEAQFTPGVRPLHDILAKTCGVLAVGFLTISVFEGAIRYYGARAGLVGLVYLKDVMMFAALFAGVLRALLTNLRNLPLLVVAGFLIVGTVIGVSTLPDIRQPFFAAKSWLPLLCGTVVAPAIDMQSRFFRSACGWLWLATVAGVFLTARWQAPWVGFNYEIGGMVVEGSREWSIGGIARVAGFSRSSFDAALQCVFLGVILAASFRFYLFSLGVWAVSGAAIYLTTSRSALAALAVALGLHLLMRWHSTTQRLAKLAVIFLAATVVVLPFAAGYYYKNKAVSLDADSVASASSFQERATKVWPEALRLPGNRGNFIIGRGLGGVGVGQKSFEPQLYNPADNFFIYLWVAFGVTGVLLVAFIPFQALRAQLPLTETRRTGMILAGTFLCVGFTLNGIESPIASFFLGTALVWLTYKTSAEDQAFGLTHEASAT